MIKYYKYLIIGILVGIAKIIPGVSGAVIAISFGVYDLGIDAITSFFKNKKKNICFLVSFGTGVILGIILFSNIISYLINNYYVIVMLLFTGLVLGGTVNISKNIKKDKYSYLLISLSIIIILFLGISSINNNYTIKGNYVDYIIYFVAGFMEAIGTIVPGISSTALLMIMGVYDIFINVLADIYNISNIEFVMFFGIGLFLGIIIVSYIIDYLFKKFRDRTYSFIIGISIGSVILMLFKSMLNGFNFINILIGIILFVVGYFISCFLD